MSLTMHPRQLKSKQEFVPIAQCYTSYLALEFAIFQLMVSTKTSRTEIRYLWGAPDHGRESLLGIAKVI
jgi:hypothetical protein